MNKTYDILNFETKEKDETKKMRAIFSFLLFIKRYIGFTQNYLDKVVFSNILPNTILGLYL